MSNEKIKQIKIIFMGTPDFAVPAFIKLIQDKRFNVVSVITQPDKKVGRKQALTPPPIKQVAEKFHVQVLQPNKISGAFSEISNLKPDFIVVIAYGQILPKEILDIPKYGSINIHGSLLPKYRGASCVQAAILNNDKKTGVTIILMDEKIDTGHILKQGQISIDDEETAQTLHNKLAELGANILPETIINYVSKKITPKPQDNSRANYVCQLKKQDGKINWEKPAKEIERMVRALNPWPGTFTKLAGKIIKILNVENKILKININKIGQLFIYKDMLAVQCGKDALIINKLQIEGKKIISGNDFMQGYKELVNNILK
ncbi:MAG: methionyl-tRNA formyltransferase [Patescibacteria group bacterium]